MTHHVVCHDCTFERIVDDESDAQALTEEHADQVGHDVEYAEVTR